MNGLRIGSLCSGYGGLDTAVRTVFGGSVVWHADSDPGAAAILTHHWPHTPNLGDIAATDWRAVPPVDVLTAGYPCQPFSLAGRQKGLADDRHIWPHIATALRVLRPRYAIFENVPGHLRLGFDTVLTDLAALGFDAEWCLARADEVGAPHRRERLFLLAWPADTASPRLETGWEGRPGGDAPADTDDRSNSPLPDREPVEPEAHHHDDEQHAPRRVLDWGDYTPAIHRWEHVTGRPAPAPTEPGRTGNTRLSPHFVEWLMGLDDGHVTAVPGLTRTQQLRALGNGVVPQQATTALHQLLNRQAQTTHQTVAA